jgi:BioD-like phosphotransacetylase family protein
LGIAKNYRGRIGYYKPFRETLVKSGDDMVDQDALLMSRVLGLEDAGLLSPFTYDIHESLSMDDIVERHRLLSKDKDLMIIEGAREPATGFAHLLSNTDIAKALNVPLIVVSTTSRRSLDMVAVTEGLCKAKGLDMMGVIFNKVAERSERKFLEDRGIKVLGEVPDMPELKKFVVSDILDNMDARVIAGEKGIDKIVETMLLGTMNIQAGMGEMRKEKRKVLIAGGDRTELLIAALSTDTSCIIIHGGIRPSSTVISRANELGVPILTTSEYTIHIAEIVEHLFQHLDQNDKDKIDTIANRVYENVDLQEIWK